MEKSTEVLAGEHNLIRQALDNFSLAVEKMENGERPPKEFFETVVNFSRTFSDKFHHFKEEHLMFNTLAQKKEGAIDAQIDSLKHQHERGRDLVTVVDKSIDGYSRGEESQSMDLLESLASYISLLRHHIHREDYVFYPLVDKELSQEEQAALLSEFKKEEAKLGGNTYQECEKLVKEMGTLL